MQGWQQEATRIFTYVDPQSHTGGMHTEVRGLVVPGHYGRSAAFEKLSLWGCALMVICIEMQGG